MCDYDWCTTQHPAGIHPSDDDHRSSGVATPTPVRRVDETGEGTDVDLEVGLIRRRTDGQTWLVLDAGNGIGIELGLDGARRVFRALLREEALRSALDL